MKANIGYRVYFEEIYPEDFDYEPEQSNFDLLFLVERNTFIPDEISLSTLLFNWICYLGEYNNDNIKFILDGENTIIEIKGSKDMIPPSDRSIIFDYRILQINKEIHISDYETESGVLFSNGENTLGRKFCGMTARQEFLKVCDMLEDEELMEREKEKYQKFVDNKYFNFID